MLSDPDPASARLDLAWTGGGPMMAFLRQVPVLQTVVPAPQAIRWGAVAVYRIRLQVERPCGAACYAAVLLDAARVPSSPAPRGAGRGAAVL
jgi:hypothetical protein